MYCVCVSIDGYIVNVMGYMVRMKQNWQQTMAITAHSVDQRLARKDHVSHEYRLNSTYVMTLKNKIIGFGSHIWTACLKKDVRWKNIIVTFFLKRKYCLNFSLKIVKSNTHLHNYLTFFLKSDPKFLKIFLN